MPGTICAATSRIFSGGWKRRIGWGAPMARALRGASVGDLRTVRLPAGEKEWEVLAISYPAA